MENIKLKTVKTEWDVYFDMACVMLEEIMKNNAVGKNTVMIVPCGPTDQYPILADILADEDAVAEVLTYRGLYDLRAENIHFGDVMMCYGMVTNN